MKLRILIVILSVILVCLLALIPFIPRMNAPESPGTSGSSTAQMVASSFQATQLASSQAVVPPTSQAVTQPSTQTTTAPPPKEYSENTVVKAFIQKRLNSWTCPVKDEFGEVTGSRKFATSRGGGTRAHAGLDFVAPHGTKVYAITSGTVQRVAVFYQSTWAVEVANDDGSVLRYCEIATELEVGDRVEQGDTIGTIMRADGGTEMLHMEVYLGDEEGMLTQSGNRTYKYVDDSKYYVRRSDLLDPTFLKDLSKG